MTTENVQLNKEEKERYSRHIIIPDFGAEGQKRLKQSRALVIGAGGLGAPLLQYLSAAGVGTIGIVDFDRVEDSNLQRQVLFGVRDIGRSKSQTAKEKIQNLNPYITVKVHEDRLTSENAREIIRQYDIVVDGTDNFPTRYLVNDACVLEGVPNVYGSIFRFDGQLAVFNYTDENGNTGPNYRDLYPDPPPPGLVPSCAEGGVLGVLPGIIGSMQANEAIKILSKTGEPLSGKLLIFDALTFEFRKLNVRKDPNNPISGNNPTLTELIDYEQFCGIPQEEPAEEEQEKESMSQTAQTNGQMKEITVNQLKEWLDKGEDVPLIDVREPTEYEIVNIDGKLIPMNEVEERKDEIPTDKPVVVHCRSGKRSADIIEVLQEEGYENLYNLKGGILAWADEIDPSLPKY